MESYEGNRTPAKTVKISQQLPTQQNHHSSSHRRDNNSKSTTSPPSRNRNSNAASGAGGATATTRKPGVLIAKPPTTKSKAPPKPVMPGPGAYNVSDATVSRPHGGVILPIRHAGEEGGGISPDGNYPPDGAMAASGRRSNSPRSGGATDVATAAVSSARGSKGGDEHHHQQQQHTYQNGLRQGEPGMYKLPSIFDPPSGKGAWTPRRSINASSPRTARNVLGVDLYDLSKRPGPGSYFRRIDSRSFTGRDRSMRPKIWFERLNRGEYSANLPSVMTARD